MRCVSLLLLLCALPAVGCRHDISLTPPDARVDAPADAPAEDTTHDTGARDGEADRADLPDDASADLRDSSADVSLDASGGCSALAQFEVVGINASCRSTYMAIGAGVSCQSGLSESRSSATRWKVACPGASATVGRCLDASKVTTERDDFSAASGGAICPVGVVVGGGCKCDPGHIEESYPTPDENGWRCTCSAAGANSVDAYCVMLPAACVTVRAAQKNNSPKCLGALLSGGCRSSQGVGTQGEVTKTWACGANATHAYAVCAGK